MRCDDGVHNSTPSAACPSPRWLLGQPRQQTHHQLLLQMHVAACVSVYAHVKAAGVLLAPPLYLVG